jgi:hypothetical protein
VRNEFLIRRHHGIWETVADGCEQEAQTRFPISRPPPGSIERRYGEAIVIPRSPAIFLLPGPGFKTSNPVKRIFGYSFFKGELNVRHTSIQDKKVIVI